MKENNNIAWYKHFFSYFFLVTVKRIHSEFNPGLCVQMEAGKLVLNTKNANYSYGNLHKVFELAFTALKPEEINFQNVLVLGLGTGSVIDILQRNYGLNPSITAYEIDPAILEVLEYWSELDLKNTKVIKADVFDGIIGKSGEYDLIVVDLFNDLEVADGIHQKDFLKKLKDVLSDDGLILINYVVNNAQQGLRFNELQISLSGIFKTITGHHFLGMNRVLEIRK
ncbi:MAG: hypothetical protein H6605_05200 [Flavobacteriales bacterium]|nr:hypothetical protein [Flavobacteriales bacterium]